MGFREDEIGRIVGIREDLFGDLGGGEYRGKKREFVLRDAQLNLWDGIRGDAVDYFIVNKIHWWGDKGERPTGHLLSSQIACLNHLFFARQRKDVVAAILRNIRSDIMEAKVVDNGFVEFEVVGSRNYLGERSHTRGANATSIDAMMVGMKADGENVLVMIEWKYTEKPRPRNMYIPARARIYDRLLTDPSCPIHAQSLENLYSDPFYQLMRQTLLGWKMVQNREHNCDEYIHLHVIPPGNKKLREKVTAPDLKGETMSEAWQSVLREPQRYRVISPEEFLLPAKGCKGTSAILAYLNRRYWDSPQLGTG